jgi:hypothetical protein
MFKTALILLVLFLFVSVQGKAQDKDYAHYDSLTYKLYMDKDYKQLLKTGKEALNAGFDYYYLRMRMGIALYNQKKYRLAVSHFEKALEYSDNDIVREYIYYAALWGGEPLRAQKLSADMSTALKVKLGLMQKSVLATSVDMAVLTRNGDIPEDFTFPEKDEGYQLVLKQFFNASLSLSHKLGKGSAMSHMLTYLYKNNLKYTYYPDYTPSDEDPYYPVNEDFNTNQFQYYITASFAVGKTWNLIFGGHIAPMAAPDYRYYESRFMGRIQYHYSKTTYWNVDFAASGSLLKNFRRASVEGEFAIMLMSDKLIMQPSGIIRLYPLGNLDLYTQSRFAYSIKENSGTFFQEHKLGFKALKHLWLEGTFFTGDVAGFTLDNSSMLFNGLEEINRMAGGRMIIPTNTKFSLSLGYQSRQITNYFLNSNDIYDKSNGLKLNYSLYFITLLWTL